MVLRQAYASRLPAGVCERAKASFPLPFAHWMPDGVYAIEGNELISSLLVPEAIDAIVADPESNWQCAWPVMNLALWSGCYW